jgi:APA family basic amino acid/polyamine antiporter
LTKRQLGLGAAAAIVIANMIGTGVFTSAGFQAMSLHDPATMLLTWVVGGVVALCGAAAYSELGSMMPRVGGEYVYLRRAYHPIVGVMSGWASLVAGFSAPIAVAALLFAGYLGKVVGVDGATFGKLVAVGLIAAMTALHAFDTVIGGRVQAVFTAAKTLLIIVFIVLALAIGKGDWANLASREGGLSNVWTLSFAQALMFVSFAYSGWNAAAYIAGEIDEPRKNLPRALLAGTAIVMVLYILLNLVFLYAVPPEQLGAPIVEVGDAAARALFGERTGALISSLIALALVSAVSAMVMAGPRVYAAMAEDGALMPGLARRTKRGVPLASVVLQGLLACGFVVAADPDEIIRYVGFTLTIFGALTVGAVFVMRWKEPDAERPYKTFGYPVTPLLFIALSAWIAYAQVTKHPWESLAVAVTLAAGAVLYFQVTPRQPPDPALPAGLPRAELRDE